MSSLSVGIVGLPNVGKSTLFTALTKKQAEAANYPFCTIEPNEGTVEVKDPRLQELAAISSSQKLIYALVGFTDIAGLVKGAASGEGLGNKFLSHIRLVDAILHVVRCFEDEDITHVDGKVDPVSDVQTIELELILADLQNVENILLKLEKKAKSQKDLRTLCDLLQKLKEHLNQNQPLRKLALTTEESESLKPYNFITSKKQIFVANVGEDDVQTLSNAHVKALEAYAKNEGCQVLPICAQLEAEIAAMEPDEEAAFLEEMGLKESGLNRLIRQAFHTLGLITFLTTGPQETRAWTVKMDAPAAEAAGKIHTDIQKGFIRAEVITFEDFISLKGRAGAKEAGKMRSEGKEYPVQDGDVILFLHN